MVVACTCDTAPFTTVASAGIRYDVGGRVAVLVASDVTVVVRVRDAVAVGSVARCGMGSTGHGASCAG